jgi:hypothetical protein
MAQAIPVVTRASAAAPRASATDGYVSQPLIMSRAALGVFRAAATINLEGLTLPSGELSTGAFGEGYVDKRHPHAYVHELMVGAQGSRGVAAASLFAGRGFVPFGSDDPMVRPFEKYPVNHHLAQILERPVAIGALRYGPIIGELSTFGGDEPTHPSSIPVWANFGDSWSGRFTLLPFDDGELSASLANIASPEQPNGNGLDQWKSIVVARVHRDSPRGARYALAEWARTAERDRGRTITTLNSVLVEGGACMARGSLALRVEHTDRPEEERLASPFRTVRPPADLSNLGVSRFTTVTAALGAPSVSTGALSALPFVEVSRVLVGRGQPAGVFDPIVQYGSTRLWMLSAGVRLSAGMAHGRMGRYGAAVPGRGMQMSMPMPMGAAAHGDGSHMDAPRALTTSKCLPSL